MQPMTDTERAEYEDDLRRMRAISRRQIIELDRLTAEREKLHAETGKLDAERKKFATEAVWYPFAVVGTVLGAAAVLAKVVFPALGV